MWEHGNEIFCKYIKAFPGTLISEIYLKRFCKLSVIKQLVFFYSDQL